MHIPKLLLVTAFLAAVGANSLHAQKPDSDAQAKAREALEAAPAEPTPPPAPAVMPKPEPAPKPPVVPAPVATAAGDPPPPAPAPTATQAPPVMPPPAPAAAPASAEKTQQLLKPVPVAATPAHVSAMAPLGEPNAQPASTLTPEQLELAREALSNPAAAAPAQVNPHATNAAAPQMPNAADSQEARLAELLLLYKNDQITPTEYQVRRAKILSGK